MKETIKEARIAKQKLEKEIGELLFDFTNKEGLIVKHIYFEIIKTVGTDIPVTYIVNTEINL